MECHADAQAFDRPDGYAQFEIDARTVEHRFLVEVGVVQLRFEQVACRVGRRAVVVAVILAVVDARGLVYALDADRGADIDDVVQIGARRDGELVDRTRIDDVHVMEDRRVAADAVGNIGGLFLLCLGIGIEVAADHKTVVTQHCRPVIGIDIIAQFVVAVGKDAGLSELLPEDVGDRRTKGRARSPASRWASG